VAENKDTNPLANVYKQIAQYSLKKLETAAKISEELGPLLPTLIGACKLLAELVKRAETNQLDDSDIVMIVADAKKLFLDSGSQS